MTIVNKPQKIIVTEMESLFIEKWEYIISPDMDITSTIKVHRYYRDAFRKWIPI